MALLSMLPCHSPSADCDTPLTVTGIVGNRYKDPAFFDMKTIEGPSVDGGFKQQILAMGPSNTFNTQAYSPPSLVSIENVYPEGGKFKLALYASPTRPGWTRHIGCQVRSPYHSSHLIPPTLDRATV